MPKFNVTGSVFFADGFNYEIEAENAEAAERAAIYRATQDESFAPAKQEVCVETIQAVGETT